MLPPGNIGGPVMLKSNAANVLWQLGAEELYALRG